MIRPATASDLNPWFELRRQLWPDSTEAEARWWLEATLAGPARHALYVACDDHGQVVGFAEASLRLEHVNGTTASPVGFLEGLYVAPSARRAGFARELVLAVEGWASRQGARELASDAELTNALGQEVHLALGFSETERVVFYRKPLGARRPANPAWPLREDYDRLAPRYAEELCDELEHKPLDRELLDGLDPVGGRHGLVADLGCGPGHVGARLARRGLRVLGFDLSPGMVAEARRRYLGPRFVASDFCALALPDERLAAAVAFYAIVHLRPDALGPVFGEWARVLAPGAPLLVAFHLGEGSVHQDEMWGTPVSLDFFLHDTAHVAQALREQGFAIDRQLERDPYEGVEYPSRRGYILARRGGKG